MKDQAEPYCGNCGHRLTGLVDSSKCPECGRPLVEVLSRSGAWGKRFTSKHAMFGLPLVNVALGPVPGERIGHARGVIAIGDRATGLVAFGGRARGVVACGGVAIGLFSVGGISIGLVSAWGGVALGALATGGLAIGGLASGGVAMGLVAAGGMAIGYAAAGGLPVGVHTLGPGAQSSEAAAIFGKLPWMFGSGQGGFSIWQMVQPHIATLGSTVVVAAVIGLLAILRNWSAERSAPPDDLR